MQDATRTLMGERDWWRRVGEERHYALTDAAHELSDESARAMQLLALCCGALTHDAGWGEDDVTALVSAVRERIPYACGVITDHVESLIHAGYRGRGDIDSAPDQA